MLAINCMWLSDKGKQAFKCTKRQHLENTKRSKRVFYCCKQRLDLVRSCFEFVKVGYAFVENVNNLKCQMFVKVELHQLLARVKANMWASELERIAIL